MLIENFMIYVFYYVERTRQPVVRVQRVEHRVNYTL